MLNLYYFRIYDEHNHAKIYKVKAFSNPLAFKKLLTSKTFLLPENVHQVKLIQKTVLKPKTTKKACKPTTPTQ